MRSNLTAVFTFIVCGVFPLSAQNVNPFELLWRKDTTGLVVSKYVEPPVNSASDISTSPQDVAESKPVLPEISATVPATSQIPVEPERDSIVVEEVITHDTSMKTDVAIAPDTGIQSNSHTGSMLLPKISDIPRRPEKSTPLMPVLLFGVIFSLLAWGMSLNREILQKIYRASLNENLSSLLYREQRFATTQYLYYTIYIIFFLNGGMFLYFLAYEYGWQAWAFGSILSCIALVTIVYLLRHISLSILGSTYPIGKETTHFSFNILIHNILLGIGLIPVNLFLAFGPESIHRFAAIAGLILCALVYIMRQFRGLLISGSVISAAPFRFFIYLCAVEILPLFTLVKFFHN